MATATYVIGLENGVRKLIRTTTTSSGSNDANKLTLLGPTGMLDATLPCRPSYEGLKLHERDYPIGILLLADLPMRD